MITDTHNWRRLTPDAIADLPETGGVFEIATLVRTVQFIGSGAGNLRTRLSAYVQGDLKQRPVTGGYYFRYEPASREQEALDSRLASYRKGHGGLLPAGNLEAPAPRRVPARRAA